MTKLMNKVTIGNYKLGANSGNILVQDRLTGQLQEEKMAIYVRLGIRVLYKGWRNKMEGARGELPTHCVSDEFELMIQLDDYSNHSRSNKVLNTIIQIQQPIFPDSSLSTI